MVVTGTETQNKTGKLYLLTHLETYLVPIPLLFLIFIYWTPTLFVTNLVTFITNPCRLSVISCQCMNIE